MPVTTRAVTVLVMLALSAFALGACASHQAMPDQVQTAAATIDWGGAKAVAVNLTDFDFTPSQLGFQAGQPVRLVLANTGSGLHDFSAPAFFAAASYRQGGTLPRGGKVAVAQNQTAEIDLVPGAPGQYPLDCTEFLHAMLGMTGAINVEAGNVTAGNVATAPH